MSIERHRNGEASSGVHGHFFLILKGTRYPKPVAKVALKFAGITIKITKNFKYQDRAILFWHLILQQVLIALGGG